MSCLARAFTTVPYLSNSVLIAPSSCQTSLDLFCKIQMPLQHPFHPNHQLGSASTSKRQLMVLYLYRGGGQLNHNLVRIVVGLSAPCRQRRNVRKTGERLKLSVHPANI